MLAFPPSLAAALRVSGASAVVTGGGGWLGRAVLEMLDSALGAEIEKRLHVFGSTARPLTLRSGRIIASRPLAEIEALPTGPYIFFHLAFLTRDKVSAQPFEDYIAANEQITAHVASAITRCEARGLFMPSSGAVYRADRSLEHDRAANPYGALKVADEKLFSALAAQQGFTAVIPRLFNLSGPFINKVEHYALSSMILAAQKGGPIIIRAPHRVVRSYTHVGDLLSLGLAHMLGQKPATYVFDTRGEVDVEMGDLARAVLAALGLASVTIERPPLDIGKEDVYIGAGADYEQLMQAAGLERTLLAQQVLETAAYLKALASAPVAA